MIIGNGLLAKAFSPSFANQAHVIVFASGVANSRETRPEEFARERNMLQEACAAGKKLLYFSTCSVHDPELAHSPYVDHKREMEELVSALPEHVILRLPQVVGHTPNPHTLTNFLYQHIQQDLPFHIWRHARRNLIDVDDIVTITKQLLANQNSAHQPSLVTNVACPFSIAVPNLVAIFEKVLGKKARCDVIEAGAQYALDTTLSTATALAAGIAFDDFYLQNLIRKYYGA